MTKVEKKVKDIEAWIADFEESNNEKLIFSNLNFLINQLKNLGDRLANVKITYTIRTSFASECKNRSRFYW